MKGAFTGADKTQEGALSSADGGVLFLDEVHRLSGEGQEKLFTYLDEGYFTMIGDNVHQHKAKIRLICATTETSDTFLATFLRRLPIQIKLPDLEERPVNEKKELIDSFFQREASQFQQNIKLSGRVLSILLNYSFPENVGQLKSAIKYIVANAHEKYGLDQTIKITIENLPAWMYVKNKSAFKNVMSISSETTYHFDGMSPDLLQKKDPNTILINKTWAKITEATGHGVTDKKIYVNLIKDAMDELIFNRPNENQDILMQFFIDTVRQMLTLFNDTNVLLYDGNLVLGIASFLYDSTNSKALEAGKTEKENFKLLANLFPEQFNIAKKMSDFLNTQLDRRLTQDDCGWLAVYISTSNNLLSRENKNIGIIITHGYATASSIANVCNRILHNNVFLAINMPISSTPDDIAVKLQEIIGTIDSDQGIVVLFDMGSLSQIAQKSLEYTKKPILLIDKVTTSGALEVGNALVMGKSLSEISKLINKDWLPMAKLCQPMIEKENIILAVCMTGIGTAQQIKLMLEKSFMNVKNLRVVATDFNSLKNKGTKLGELEQYHIVCIVGTDNPAVEKVPYISMQSLITGEGTPKFDQIISSIFDDKQIKQVNQNLIRNFSLTRVIDNLTILDTHKVMNDIEEFISRLEGYLQTTVTNKVKMALFVHVSAMIERLIRQEPIGQYPQLKKKISENKKIYSVIKSSFSVLENKYRVQVPDTEIAYIIDMIALK
ncbi:sigma 54-interacting transcriptional regulator [Pediococcus parvulus]